METASFSSATETCPVGVGTTRLPEVAVSDEHVLQSPAVDVPPLDGESEDRGVHQEFLVAVGLGRRRVLDPLPLGDVQACTIKHGHVSDVPADLEGALCGLRWVARPSSFLRSCHLKEATVVGNVLSCGHPDVARMERVRGRVG